MLRYLAFLKIQRANLRLSPALDARAASLVRALVRRDPDARLGAMPLEARFGHCRTPGEAGTMERRGVKSGDGGGGFGGGVVGAEF